MKPLLSLAVLALVAVLGGPAPAALAREQVATQSRQSQAETTPQAALDLLKAGNERFADGRSLQRDYLAQVRITATGQFPFATVLACIDSRSAPELVFDQGIGDLFSPRIAGNFVNDDILGSMEFAAKLAGSKLIVVLGHTQCGAIKGACDDAALGNLTQMLAKLKPAVDGVTDDGTARNSKNPAFVQRVTDLNVQLTVDEIRRRSPVLAEMEQRGEIRIVGAMLDIATGIVTFSE